MIFLAHPTPAKRTCQLGSGSPAAKPGTECCSPPPANGSTSSPTLTQRTAAGRIAQTQPLHAARVDEVGYIPFEPEGANLFFELVSSRYERASLIVTPLAVQPLG